ncbi:hypothetical protein [Streptomyces olivaceoviridis]|uniref:hypothetical protein n=1 Tax=Streptomyces olivaceoviridis TaxID=1921 RepID=UPI0036FCDD49
MSAGEEYTRRETSLHREHFHCAGAVPIGSFTSNDPQRSQEYSYVAMKSPPRRASGPGTYT